MPADLKLMALADGEVAPADRAKVLAEIQADSAFVGIDVSKRMVQHQAGKEYCRLAGAEAFDAVCPDDLAAKLRAIPMDDQPVNQSMAQQQEAAPSVIGSIGLVSFTRWLPSAVAAMLLVSALVVFNLDSGIVSSGPGAQVVSVRTVDRMVNRHAACAIDPAKMMPVEVDAAAISDLPKTIASILPEAGQQTAALGLDLSDAGFDFVTVGVCPSPGSKAAHLLYRKTGTSGANPSDMLSIWLQAADATAATRTLQEGRVYTIDQEGCSPIRLWKQGSMIVYVASDSGKNCREAEKVFRREAI